MNTVQRINFLTILLALAVTVTRAQEPPPVLSPAFTRVWKPDVSSGFEVGTQIRAWTIKDEGMDYILDNMQSMCGVNSLYMVVVMHHTNQHG